MVRKASFFVGLGAGYMLGARSGRERYDQIMGKLQQVWSNPRVREKAEQAQDVVQDTAGQAGQAIKDKVSSVTSSSHDEAIGSETSQENLTPSGGAMR